MYAQAITSVSSRLIPYTLKKEQYDTIDKLLTGSNVFCTLPTGFGKSDIYVTPFVSDKVNMIYYLYMRGGGYQGIDAEVGGGGVSGIYV